MHVVTNCVSNNLNLHDIELFVDTTDIIYLLNIGRCTVFILRGTMGCDNINPVSTKKVY